MNAAGEVRRAVRSRLGDLADDVWSGAYEQAIKKLRRIVGMYGDGGGERNTVDYIAQLVIEAIRAEELKAELAARYERTKGVEADTKDDPHGHTLMILRNAPQSQEIFV